MGDNGTFGGREDAKPYFAKVFEKILEQKSRGSSKSSELQGFNLPVCLALLRSELARARLDQIRSQTKEQPGGPSSEDAAEAIMITAMSYMIHFLTSSLFSSHTNTTPPITIDRTRRVEGKQKRKDNQLNPEENDGVTTGEKNKSDILPTVSAIDISQELPDEIWIHIFTYVVAEDERIPKTSGSSYTTDRDGEMSSEMAHGWDHGARTVLLSVVCFRWRNIVVSTPRLWSHVYINLDSGPFALMTMMEHQIYHSPSSEWSHYPHLSKDDRPQSPFPSRITLTAFKNGDNMWMESFESEDFRPLRRWLQSAAEVRCVPQKKGLTKLRRFLDNITGVPTLIIDGRFIQRRPRLEIRQGFQTGMKNLVVFGAPFTMDTAVDDWDTLDDDVVPRFGLSAKLQTIIYRHLYDVPSPISGDFVADHHSSLEYLTLNPHPNHPIKPPTRHLQPSILLPNLAAQSIGAGTVSFELLWRVEMPLRSFLRFFRSGFRFPVLRELSITRMDRTKSAEWNYFITHSNHRPRVAPDEELSVSVRTPPDFQPQQPIQLAKGPGIETICIRRAHREDAIQLLSFLQRLSLLQRLVISGPAVDNVLAALAGDSNRNEEDASLESGVLSGLRYLVLEGYNGNGEAIEELVRLLASRPRRSVYDGPRSKLLIECTKCDKISRDIRRLISDYNHNL